MRRNQRSTNDFILMCSMKSVQNAKYKRHIKPKTDNFSYRIDTKHTTLSGIPIQYPKNSAFVPNRCLMPIEIT